MWALRVDGNEIKCYLDRPSMNIEEVEQPNGSYVPGKATWNPLPINFGDFNFGWSGAKTVELVLYSRPSCIKTAIHMCCQTESPRPLEIWTLKDAKFEDGKLIVSEVSYQA